MKNENSPMNYENLPSKFEEFAIDKLKIEKDITDIKEENNRNITQLNQMIAKKYVELSAAKDETTFTTINDEITQLIDEIDNIENNVEIIVEEKNKELSEKIKLIEKIKDICEEQIEKLNEQIIISEEDAKKSEIYNEQNVKKQNEIEEKIQEIKAKIQEINFYFNNGLITDTDLKIKNELESQMQKLEKEKNETWISKGETLETKKLNEEKRKLELFEGLLERCKKINSNDELEEQEWYKRENSEINDEEKEWYKRENSEINEEEKPWYLREDQNENDEISEDLIPETITTEEIEEPEIIAGDSLEEQEIEEIKPIKIEKLISENDEEQIEKIQPEGIIDKTGAVIYEIPDTKKQPLTMEQKESENNLEDFVNVEKKVNTDTEDDEDEIIMAGTNEQETPNENLIDIDDIMAILGKTSQEVKQQDDLQFDSEDDISLEKIEPKYEIEEQEIENIDEQDENELEEQEIENIDEQNENEIEEQEIENVDEQEKRFSINRIKETTKAKIIELIEKYAKKVPEQDYEKYDLSMITYGYADGIDGRVYFLVNDQDNDSIEDLLNGKSDYFVIDGTIGREKITKFINENIKKTVKEARKKVMKIARKIKRKTTIENINNLKEQAKKFLKRIGIKKTFECPSCGKMNYEDNDFCEKCGRILKYVEEEKNSGRKY